MEQVMAKSKAMLLLFGISLKNLKNNENTKATLNENVTIIIILNIKNN